MHVVNDLCLLQLNQYTKYVDPVSVVQDITSHAKSVCDEKFKETKLINSDEVRVFFSMVILVPIITMAILVLVVRSTHEHIHDKITGTSAKGYQNLVGFTLAGIIVMIFILIMDMAAVHYYSVDEDEYRSNSLHGTVNLFSPAITLVFDLIITILCLTFIIYVCSVQVAQKKRTSRLAKILLYLKVTSYLKVFTVPYFYVIFGSKTESMLRDLGKQEKSAKVQKAVNIWVISGVAVAPFLCFSSHAGYILMAWVTDPVRTTAAFFIALGCCLYLFFMFRQCYSVHAENDDKDNTADIEETTTSIIEEMKPIMFHNATDPADEYNPLHDVPQTNYGSTETSNRGSRDVDDNAGCCNCCKCVIVFFLTPLLWLMTILCAVIAQVTIIWLVLYRCYKRKNLMPTDFLRNLKPVKTKKAELSYLGMMISFGMSLLIVVPLALVLSSFFFIPVSTYILAQCLENTSQIVIVVFGLLISYKIFTRTESDIEIFMRTFQDMARKNKQRGKERQQVRIRNKSKSRNKAPQLSQRKPSGEQKGQEGRTKIPIEEEETTTPTVEITQSQLEFSDEEYENDVEAGGAIAGELTGKLINYLDTEEDNEQEEQKQKQDQDKKDQDKKDQDRQDQDEDEERVKEKDEANANSQAQEGTIPEVEIQDQDEDEERVKEKDEANANSQAQEGTIQEVEIHST